jgi:hypothetical protein
MKTDVRLKIYLDAVSALLLDGIGCSGSGPG